MKLLILFIFCLLDLQWAGGQTKSNVINPELALRDSLMSVINMQKGDTNEVNALAEMAMINTTLDSGIIYGERGISLAKSLNYAKGEAECLYSCSVRFSDMRYSS